MCTLHRIRDCLNTKVGGPERRRNENTLGGQDSHAAVEGGENEAEVSTPARGESETAGAWYTFVLVRYEDGGCGGHAATREGGMRNCRAQVTPRKSQISRSATPTATIALENRERERATTGRGWDSKKNITRIVVGSANGKKDLSPGNDEVLDRIRVEMGQHVDETTGCECRRTVTADQVNSEQLSITSQGDANNAIAAVG